MAATLEQVAAALLDAQQVMLAMRLQFDAQLRGMKDQVEEATRIPARPEVRSIDTRVLGKPEPFDGQTGWRDWSTVFRAYSGACIQDLERMMARAEVNMGPSLM